ncbi:MAG: hypothetical protein P8Z33_13925, partial [Gammaproteobacteria bacterium]
MATFVYQAFAIPRASRLPDWPAAMVSWIAQWIIFSWLRTLLEQLRMGASPDEDDQPRLPAVVDLVGE